MEWAAVIFIAAIAYVAVTAAQGRWYRSLHERLGSARHDRDRTSNFAKLVSAYVKTDSTTGRTERIIVLSIGLCALMILIGGALARLAFG